MAEQIHAPHEHIDHEIVPFPGEEVDPFICYVLVRTDVPNFMWGKTAAQTHHNGMHMMYDAMQKKDRKLFADIEEWASVTDQGFGTVLTLAVDAADMRQAVSLAELLGLHAGVTHDPTYPILDGDKCHTLPVDTCAYVFGKKSKCAAVVGTFDLLHEDHVR